MQRHSMVIAEGRTLFRQGLAALLRAAPEFEIAGEAANAEETRRVCARVQPQLIVLDAALPGGESQNGLNVIPGLRLCCPKSTIVVIGEAGGGLAEEETERAVGAERRRALLQGAAAYLCPSVDQTELLRILRLVMQTGRGTSPPAPHSRNEGSDWSGEWEAEGLESVSPVSKCTEREKTIIVLIAQGLCNKEVAHRLGISTQTVKNHVSHLLEKLNLADRTQLAVYALEHHFRL